MPFADGIGRPEPWPEGTPLAGRDDARWGLVPLVGPGIALRTCCGMLGPPGSAPDCVAFAKRAAALGKLAPRS